jgi:hypothetical protein
MNDKMPNEKTVVKRMAKALFGLAVIIVTGRKLIESSTPVKARIAIKKPNNQYITVKSAKLK